MVVGGAAVLSFSDSRWPELLALALGLAATLRARLFRRTAQVLCLLVAGILSLGLLIVGVSLDLPRFLYRNLGDASAADVRTVALAAAIALGAVVLVAVALIVPARGVPPFWARILDLADGLVLAALIPLALAVLDVYARVRGLS